MDSLLNKDKFDNKEGVIKNDGEEWRIEYEEGRRIMEN